VSEESYAVTVAVRRQDGSIEQVRVGSAVRTDEGFSLRLGELTVSPNPERRTAPAASTSTPGDLPTVFPPYGRSKGLPIHGASEGDLDFYANGARRSLADPGKARWHEKERSLLAAIDAERARQGMGGGEEPPPPGDGDAPF
jgi:hypothetical protein